MAEDAWSSLDLPILEAVAAIESEGGWPTAAGIAHRVGADAETASVRIKALDAGGFVAVSAYQSNGEPMDVTLLRDARQAIGQWPNVGDLFDRFVRAIEAAADDQPDEEERSRLRAVLPNSAQPAETSWCR
jgi:hypothetical protein